MEHRWGMTIDLDRCTGCEACVAACHAENNIPISDPVEAAKNRVIHWIRVDHYYEGEFPDVKVKHMPVLCQHCDNAPCEPVCPVQALSLIHISEPTRLLSISYAVFCLKKKK